MTISSRRPALFVAACFLLLAPTLPSQTAGSTPSTQLAPAPDTANPNMQPVRSTAPSGVALSPDGKTVTYIFGGGRRGGGALHVVRVAEPTQDKVIAPAGRAGCGTSDPVWSPDSQWLAMLSNCFADAAKPEQQQVVLWSKASGEFKPLTHVVGNLAQLAWSPDGKKLAFLFVENATRSAGALDAMKPWSGVIGEDGVEVQRIYLVSVGDGKGQFISPEKLHVYEFTFNPVKEEVAYVAAPPPGENTWWIAKLYTDTPAPNTLATILDPTTIPGPLHGLQIAVPRYSPDGKRIAFIGGLMSDQGSTGGDVWVVDAKGGEPVDLTAGIDGTPVFEAWLTKREIGFVEDRRGHTHLVDWDTETKSEVGNKDLGEVSIAGGAIKDAVSISNKNELAFVMSGFKVSPQVEFLNTGNGLEPMTHLNDNATTMARTESIEWENEGFHVQGWLTYPKDYDEKKKYPLIVEVHGGPSSSVGSRWGGSPWAALGYFVFQPNPRGSFGQGEAFVQANKKDFGYGDLRDILKGMDAVEAKVSIDKNREGLTGWSYGGFMTMFGVTQTHRFKAAVAGAGISDWQSYYGENSIDQWMTPFFGASVYDDPAVYAKSSAINFIKNVTTPTLVIVGDRDGECPAPQSFEFWHALRAEGVKTQLVIYPNEGHGFKDPKHIADRMEREVRWFAENMPKGK
jgi:dipeptidyl aminopeptidase/acylaminoacyl peptidase